MDEKLPLISIVTICYNTKNDIEKTILSVLALSYPKVEYIVIDGGSTDGTVSVINNYRNKIAFFVSEPDKGIYDGMNKGIRASNGEWIIFMNAGDIFASPNVIGNCFLQIDNEVKVIYGDRIAKYAKASYIEKPAPINELLFRFPIFHQSTFIKSDIMKEFEYNTKFRICGDFDFFRKIYIRGDKFKYVDEVISKCDCISGISNNLSQSKQRVYEDCIVIHGEITVKDIMSIAYAQIASFAKLLWNKVSPSTYERWRYKTYDSNPYLKRL